MIPISSYNNKWPVDTPIWQSKLWFDCWDETFSKVYILEKNNNIIPICINQNKKEYASWEATDFIFPFTNWEVFKNESIYIPHLVKPLTYSNCYEESNKFVRHTTQYPKTSFFNRLKNKSKNIKNLRRAVYENYIPETVIDEILIHKKHKYNTDKFIKVSSFIKSLFNNKFPLIVHVLYDDKIYVAGNIGIKTHRGLGHWILSHNKNYDKFSPGHLLIWFMLEDAIYKKVSLDFMRGDGNYKLKWNPVTEPLFSTIL